MSECVCVCLNQPYLLYTHTHSAHIMQHVWHHLPGKTGYISHAYSVDLTQSLSSLLSSPLSHPLSPTILHYTTQHNTTQHNRRRRINPRLHCQLYHPTTSPRTRVSWTLAMQRMRETSMSTMLTWLVDWMNTGDTDTDIDIDTDNASICLSVHVCLTSWYLTSPMTDILWTCSLMMVRVCRLSAGCTAVVALKHGDEMFVANAGTSLWCDVVWCGVRCSVVLCCVVSRSVVLCGVVV